MYPLGRNFRRCQIKFRDFVKVSERFTNNKLDSDILKCETLLKSLYQNCINEPDNYTMPVRSSCLIHLQQLLMVSSYNLLVNEGETSDKEQLEPEPLQLDTTYNRFTVGYAIQTLEYILKRQVYGDLLERLELIIDQNYLDDEDELKILDVQNEAIDRILQELHYLARQKINSA